MPLPSLRDVWSPLLVQPNLGAASSNHVICIFFFNHFSSYYTPADGGIFTLQILINIYEEERSSELLGKVGEERARPFLASQTQTPPWFLEPQNKG